MNIALFGGTFDPVHRGHIEVARAAARRYKLHTIYFVPADIPPHKRERPLTPYYHRYAMLALATQGEKRFVPSLLEAAVLQEAKAASPSYSIDTVRRLKSSMRKTDRLFFIIGMDAFRDIGTWREPEALLRETEFIVASRPGHSLADVGRALPESLRPEAGALRALRKTPAVGDVALSGVTIHLLADVNVAVSATQIRSAAARGKSVERFTGPAVAEYIRKMHLYREARDKAGPSPSASLGMTNRDD